MMNTHEEIDTADKRHAALHEAAHATVLAFKGGRCCPWVERTGTTDPENKKLWVGHCQAVGSPIDSVTAVAGMVGEYLDHTQDTTAWEIIDYWESFEEDMSATDLKHCPASWSEREAAVAEALSILRREDRLFREIVRLLIEDECVTDGMLAEMAGDKLAV